MAESFKKGDEVEWNTSQGKATGKVLEKLTEPTDLEGRHVAAAEGDPQYLLESGKRATYKPEALRKKG